MQQLEYISSGDPDYQESIFSWEINDVCQYRCEYCYCKDRLRKTFTPKYRQVYLVVLKKLKLSKNKNYKVELLGGEPTLHPEIKYIVDELTSYDQCNTIELVTNLTKSVDWYKEIETDKMLISASLHPRYYNEKFYIKCKELTDMNSNLHVVVNLPNQMTEWRTVRDFMNRALDNGMYVKYNYIHDVEGIYTSSYSDEFYDYFSTTLDKCNNEMVRFVKDNGDVDLVPEYLARRDNMISFYNKFKCTPKNWFVSLDGNIHNTCTGEELDITMSNLEKEVVCPVSDSCNICNMLFKYHKTKL